MSESDAFWVGYLAYQTLFQDPAVDRARITNPFREDTDQYRGFEAARTAFNPK